MVCNLFPWKTKDQSINNSFSKEVSEAVQVEFEGETIPLKLDIYCACLLVQHNMLTYSSML